MLVDRSVHILMRERYNVCLCIQQKRIYTTNTNYMTLNYEHMLYICIYIIYVQMHTYSWYMYTYQ